ncbi:MAG TPA: prepilin peptidase [Sphingomonas sp.]|uniref:A24 family peptidase n=1 Tax=Sphingomonas sp. TaxID=28214 RepID=UPI002BB9CB48|nr:prepilin peptidase [Sphingomonas sp.]HMI18028.1 prepilin peptidase [Sphingomonas sp.]
MSVYAICMLCLLAALLVTAAVTDIRARIISNRLNAAIALLAVPWWFAIGYGGSDILFQLGLSAALLVVFAIFFALRMMGGGDVKLLAALGLWLPLTKMLILLEWMAIGGGVLTLGMVIAHRVRKAPGKPEIPYGVAIVGASLLVLANDILTKSVA